MEIWKLKLFAVICQSVIASVMNTVLDFLKSRNIENADQVAREMDCNKVDLAVISVLKEDDYKLRNWLPGYGDRMALINWSKQNQYKKSKKNNLLDKLMNKVKNENRRSFGEMCSSDDTDQPLVKTFKSNAFKTTRSIQIGWLHFDKKDNKYKQVREPSGGGIRSIQCPKYAKPVDLLLKSKELFFSQDNMTVFGNWEELDVEMFDFKRKPIEEDTTVIELYEKTGLPKLRYYLATRRKSGIRSFIQNSKNYTEASMEHVNPLTPDPPKSATLEFSVANDSIIKGTDDFDNNELTTRHFDYCDGDINTIPLDSSTMYDIVELGLSPTRLLEDDIMKNQSKIIQEFYRDIDLEYNSDIPSTSSSVIHGEVDIMPPMHLILHRGNVFVEMIEAFKSIDKQKCSNLMAELILPNGESEKGLDAGGVFRDTLSEFWTTMYETCTVGTNVKIPCIRHDFKEEEWKSMAKILYVGWVNSKYLPIKLAMPIVEQMLYGHVTSKLIPTFLLSLGESDNQILNSALKDIASVDKDDLLEAFSSLECRTVPNEYNLVELLEEISHKELIQKPHFIIEQFRKELKEVRMNTLISEENLLTLYKSMEPTAKNILNILSCHETNSDEIKTFGFLKKFIKETTNEIRLKFLRFSTGADVITHNHIKVEFTNVVGLARAPVAHTCSGVLELPSKYEYFADFRKELNCILASNIWVMDIL